MFTVYSKIMQHVFENVECVSEHVQCVLIKCSMCIKKYIKLVCEKCSTCI